MRRGLDGEVLRALRDAGPRTKSQLAEGLGVPRTTLNASLRGLVAAGHVEDGPVVATGGRRSVTVRIATDRRFLVVSVGGSSARVALLDGQLTVVSGLSIDLRHRDTDKQWIADTVGRAAQRLLGPQAPVAIGVTVADVEPDVEQAMVARIGSAYAGRPLARVAPVRALALGERRQAATGLADDFVAIRLGRTVTAATVAEGQLATGSTGRSGEIGHLRVEEFGPACACGLTGCLDSFVSTGALVAQTTDLVRRGRASDLQRVLARGEGLDLGDLVGAARTGDAIVAQVARELGQRLGGVVAALVAHANPRRVVVGGPVAALGPAFLGDLRAAVYRLAPRSLTEGLEVALSDPDGRADLIGCGSAALTGWIEHDIEGSRRALPPGTVTSHWQVVRTANFQLETSDRLL